MKEIGAGRLHIAMLGMMIRVDGQRFLMFWKIERNSTRLNSSHVRISYAVFCLKKKTAHARACEPPSRSRHVRQRRAYADRAHRRSRRLLAPDARARSGVGHRLAFHARDSHSSD